MTRAIRPFLAAILPFLAAILLRAAPADCFAMEPTSPDLGSSGSLPQRGESATIEALAAQSESGGPCDKGFIPTCEQARGFGLCDTEETKAECPLTCSFDGRTEGHELWEDELSNMPSDYGKRLSPGLADRICAACSKDEDMPCCHNHPHGHGRLMSPSCELDPPLPDQDQGCWCYQSNSLWNNKYYCLSELRSLGMINWNSIRPEGNTGNHFWEAELQSLFKKFPEKGLKMEEIKGIYTESEKYYIRKVKGQCYGEEDHSKHGWQPCVRHPHTNEHGQPYFTHQCTQLHQGRPPCTEPGQTDCAYLEGSPCYKDSECQSGDGGELGNNYLQLFCNNEGSTFKEGSRCSRQMEEGRYCEYDSECKSGTCLYERLNARYYQQECTGCKGKQDWQCVDQCRSTQVWGC